MKTKNDSGRFIYSKVSTLIVVVHTFAGKEGTTKITHLAIRRPLHTIIY